MCIYPFTQDLKNQESPSAYQVFGSGMGVLLALRLFYLKSGRLDPNLLFEVEMLGLPSACIVSAMLPKTQYLREHIYQVLFSMLVHPLLQGGHSIVCGDIVSPTTLSREVFLLLIIG